MLLSILPRYLTDKSCRYKLITRRLDRINLIAKAVAGKGRRERLSDGFFEKLAPTRGCTRLLAAKSDLLRLKTAGKSPCCLATSWYFAVLRAPLIFYHLFFSPSSLRFYPPADKNSRVSRGHTYSPVLAISIVLSHLETSGRSRRDSLDGAICSPWCACRSNHRVYVHVTAASRTLHTCCARGKYPRAPATLIIAKRVIIK